jgi:acetolactate synthase I/II/III large subunit
MGQPGTRTGGEAVVAALRREGIDHAFCVPGESFLGILDALYDAPDIRVVTTRISGAS